MTRVHRLLIELGLLQVADLVTTYVALALGAHEGNPLMRGIVTSPLAAIIVKLWLIALITMLALHAPPERARRWLTIAVVVYCFVIISNLVVVGRYL